MEPTSGPERLQKLIARSGLASRRVAENWIAAGRVGVDGVTATLGQKADASTARITVDDVPLPVAPDLVYYLLHKPLGVTSTVADPHADRPVVSLVPTEPRVVPVGRLDVDTTGLIVLTNDGDLTHHLTHPSNEVTKTYQALVEGTVTRAGLSRLVGGVELEDGTASADSVELLGAREERSHVEIVLHEGRNRIVRRMCDAIGHPVIELHRSAIGPLRDPVLKSGQWRHLSIDEVRTLYAAGAT